jgi:hypothetical protein
MFFSQIKQCLYRPGAAGLEAEYDVFRRQGRFPCTRHRPDGDRRVANQCAVRMSIALSRAMNYDVMGRYRNAYPHDGNYHSADCCAARGALEAQAVPHVTRAVSLKGYLANTLGFNFQVIGADPSVISGPNMKRGIIFFLELDRGSGSHIDYWNGREYFNEYAGGASPSPRLPMFARAREVSFCALQ